MNAMQKQAYMQGYVTKCAARGDFLAKILTSGAQHFPDETAKVMSYINKLPPAAMASAKARLRYANVGSRVSEGARAAGMGISGRPALRIPVQTTRLNQALMGRIRELRDITRYPRVHEQLIDSAADVLKRVQRAAQ